LEAAFAIPFAMSLLPGIYVVAFRFPAKTAERICLVPGIASLGAVILLGRL
jgi:hypothetical protein